MLTSLERIQKDIEALAEFNATPGLGLTRFSFTQEDRGAREYIKEEMRKSGLRVYEDAAGTIVGRIEGTQDEAPIVMVGSHFDSVKNGGNFDGPAGVVTALEIARVIKQNNIKPKYPIEFIAMIEEEGGRFGSGLFASRAMAGKINRKQLELYKDKGGVSIAEAMMDFGFNPEKIEEAVRKPVDIKAFFELHIEQGPILEANQKDIGIVEYIVGIREFEIIIKGRPDHAGTTPMKMRVDALSVASQIISKIGDLAVAVGEGTVATVGVLTVLPGAANIVPGEVTFMVDIRSKKNKCIEEVAENIKKMLTEAKETTGIQYEVVEKLDVEPTELSKPIVKKFIDNSEGLGFSTEIMLSGAGHDAMVMAGLTEVGLIFVPSKNGRSHCPEEFTAYEDLQKGIELVCHTILDIAEVKVYEY